MFNAKSLLDNLTGGQGVKGLTDKAKGAWDNQSSLGKGAIAGGLLGVLLTGGGRRLIGTGLKVGGAALKGLRTTWRTSWFRPWLLRPRPMAMSRPTNVPTSTMLSAAWVWMPKPQP